MPCFTVQWNAINTETNGNLQICLSSCNFVAMCFSLGLLQCSSWSLHAVVTHWHFLGRQGQLCKAICLDAPVSKVVRFAAGKTEAMENYGKLHSVHSYSSISVRLPKIQLNVNVLYCSVRLHVYVWLARTRHVSDRLKGSPLQHVFGWNSDLLL